MTWRLSEWSCADRKYRIARSGSWASLWVLGGWSSTWGILILEGLNGGVRVFMEDGSEGGGGGQMMVKINPSLL